jgi:hypothetical protein
MAGFPRRARQAGRRAKPYLTFFPLCGIDCFFAQARPGGEFAMWHIFVKNLSTAPDAVVGIGLIAVYFLWMMGMALVRIKRGEHMEH